jgi:hypothetical protein
MACPMPKNGPKKGLRPLGVNTRFQHKFVMGSYGVGIGRAWCSWKACEICSSLVKKKLKKIYFSSHKLSKQQF